MLSQETCLNRIKVVSLFVLSTIIFIPGFLQIFPTDTQPWYILVFFVLIFLNAIKSNKNLFMFLLVFGISFCFLSFRIIFGFDDNLSKLIPITFFIVFLLLLNKNQIDFFLSISFYPILLHSFIGFLLLPFLPGLFDFLYGRLPESSIGFYSRSINFSFPEPAFAAKVFSITGFTMVLAFREKYLIKSRTLFFLSIMTLSITGIILGLLGLFYTLNFKKKVIFLIIGLFSFFLIYAGIFTLPGRLGTLQNLVINLDLSLILSDRSFLDRLVTLQNMSQEFFNFNFFGSQLTDKSISFFIYLQTGIFGFIFLSLLFFVMLMRLIIGDFIIPLVFFAIAYSDSFLYPTIIFFLTYVILDTFKRYKIFLIGRNNNAFV